MKNIKFLLIIPLLLTCSLQSMDDSKKDSQSYDGLTGTDIAKIFSTALAANKQACKEITITAKSTPDYHDNSRVCSTPVKWSHTCTISFVPQATPSAKSGSDESFDSKGKQ